MRNDQLLAFFECSWGIKIHLQLTLEAEGFSERESANAR